MSLKNVPTSSQPVGGADPLQQQAAQPVLT